MELMKTLVVDRDGAPEIAECPRPAYGGCDALVKIIACGVCNGTDMKLMHGTFKGFNEDAYPVMLGHEAVGRVIETGKDVISYKKETLSCFRSQGRSAVIRAAGAVFRNMAW